MADSQHISFTKLHATVSHYTEVTTYLLASLCHLETRIRGFVDKGDGEIPGSVKESICKTLSHDCNVAGFLFESLESTAACLCRRSNPEDDLVGRDVAPQRDHNNGETGGDA